MIRWLFLLLFSVAAHADTQPPITTTVDPQWRWQYGSTPHGTTGTLSDVRSQFPGICTGLMTALGRSAPYSGTPVPMTGYNGYCVAGTGALASQEYVRIVPVCATGSLTGSSYETYRCTGAKVCPSGYTLSPDATICNQSNPCEGKQNTPDDYAWISYNNGSSPFGAKCKGGCVVYQTGPVSHPIKNPDGATYVGGTHDKHALMKTQHTNEQCTNQSAASSGNTPQPNLPPPKPLPPCAEGEGVLTTSTGKIACVPDGTLGARKPVQQTTDERNNDGSNTVDKNKTTTKDPLTGATTTTTTTTTTDENGNVTVSTGSVSSGAGGQGDNSGEEPGQCAKEPDSPMCRKGEPSAKGNFSGDEDAELTRVKQELRDTWAQVSTQARVMWSGSLGGGGGSLPCPPPVVVMGRPFDICLSRYEGQLSMIGSAVMLIAALLSAFIIFRR